MKISIIICTHNPREEYLRRTLESLATQDLPGDEWELIVIDNASSPPLAVRLDLSCFRNARLVVEERLGLSPARVRGIAEASAPWICFVDDDNILKPDYLREALRIADDRPDLGCIGGRIEGEYEEEPPSWFGCYQEMIAVRPLDRDYWGNFHVYNKATPCGAGMVIRRDLAAYYSDLCVRSPFRLLLDRRGNSLASAGDLDIAYTVIDQGYSVGRFTALGLTHLIPAFRTKLAYLERLAEASEESSIYLIMLRHPDAFVDIRAGSLGTWKTRLKLRILVRDKISRRIQLARDRGRRKAFANIPDILATMSRT